MILIFISFVESFLMISGLYEYIYLAVIEHKNKQKIAPRPHMHTKKHCIVFFTKEVGYYISRGRCDFELGILIFLFLCSRSPLSICPIRVFWLVSPIYNYLQLCCKQLIDLCQVK